MGVAVVTEERAVTLYAQGWNRGDLIEFARLEWARSIICTVPFQDEASPDGWKVETVRGYNYVAALHIVLQDKQLAEAAEDPDRMLRAEVGTVVWEGQARPCTILSRAGQSEPAMFAIFTISRKKIKAIQVYRAHAFELTGTGVMPI